jgi:hypothetical protein
VGHRQTSEERRSQGAALQAIPEREAPSLRELTMLGEPRLRSDGAADRACSRTTSSALTGYCQGRVANVPALAIG